MIHFPKLRPCLVRGKKALFHKWIESKYFVEPSLLIGGTIGGQICHNFALIEYPDGWVTICEPKDVKFLDNVFSEYSFDEVD